MSDVLGVEKELSSAFADQTQEYKEQLIKIWVVKCAQWINQARAYKQQLEKEEGYLMELEKVATQNFENFTALLKRKRVAKKLLLNNKVLIDGYVLLNEIGETIRGEEILYSVTFTVTGNNIVSSGNGEVYTALVPLQVFLRDYVKFTHRRMNVRTDYTSLMKMVNSQIKENKFEGKLEEWSENKISAYKLFDEQVRSVKNQHFDNMSGGQMLEAFFSFGAEAVHIDKSSLYWSSLIQTAKDAKGQKPFWAGGDIADKQIKGLEASVTNISTLINGISRALDILRQSKIGADALSPYVKKAFMGNINKKATDTIEQTQNKLIEMFTEKVARKTAIKLDFN